MKFQKSRGNYLILQVLERKEHIKTSGISLVSGILIREAKIVRQCPQNSKHDFQFRTSYLSKLSLKQQVRTKIFSDL